jgi:hypothetical protein
MKKELSIGWTIVISLLVAIPIYYIISIFK